MTVAVILTRKGRDVVTTGPDSRVSDVCDLLETKGIGAVVISHDGSRVDGIFSERDFVRAVARQGSAALERPVRDYMTKAVVTCEPEDLVANVMRKMTEGKFRHLPVIEDGRLAGVISIGDVVKHRIAEAEAEAMAMREYITA
ncbi:CBS domain-containing protein [Microbaculum marinisediminis]|uniref:CBS domain-containing protein n=1 Tax=Microbaculum marinisediminis TaxID=2931392 RepID=A0AAW5R4R9_9HYPH|nr:CBS domain-containing protein [Microbaculum sp. A6E488]MCT8974928.1 CBS domain-containing protein [Microbaculum sp. A6E488]